MRIDINIVPRHYNDGADLFINDFTKRGEREYSLTPSDLHTVSELRTLLAGESDFIFDTVVGMLKEMAK